MSLKLQAAVGVKWTSISAGASAALQILRLVVLARLLDRESFGLMAMMTVVIGFAQAFQDMGLSNAIIHQKEITRDQLSSLYWLNVVAGSVLFLVICVSAPWVAGFYGEPRVTSLLPWVALTFLITPLGQLFHILLQRELQFSRMAVVEISSSLAGAVAAVLSALHNHGVFSLVLGHLVSATAAVALLWMSVPVQWRPKWHFELGDLQSYLSFGLFQLGERALNYVSWNLDKLLIGRLLGTEALGLYSVAYQLMIRPLMVINPVITRVAFPLFSVVQHEETRLKRGYLQAIRMIAFVSAPLYLGMMVVSVPLVQTVLGARWVPTSGVLQILCILGIFYSLGNPIGSLLLAKGKADIGFWFNGVGLMVYSLGIVLGSHRGLLGVAWGIVLASALVLFPLEFVVRWRLVHMTPREFLGAVVPFVGSALVMAAVVSAFATGIPSGNAVVRLCLLVPAGAAVYLLAILRVERPFLIETYVTARGAF